MRIGIQSAHPGGRWRPTASAGASPSCSWPRPPWPGPRATRRAAAEGFDPAVAVAEAQGSHRLAERARAERSVPAGALLRSSRLITRALLTL